MVGMYMLQILNYSRKSRSSLPYYALDYSIMLCHVAFCGKIKGIPLRRGNAGGFVRI